MTTGEIAPIAELDIGYYQCCLQILQRFLVAINADTDELRALESTFDSRNTSSSQRIDSFLEKLHEKEDRYEKLRDAYSGNKFEVVTDQSRDNFLGRL
ncbi:hypothetical protein IH799_04405, partial [candidate division KSB1 bacterium]|nr:hypothetical protein [candidate division KSB1 bacterium]